MAKIRDDIHHHIQMLVEESGFDLYDVQYVKEGQDYFFQVFIEPKIGERPIVIDDTATVTRKISPYLDEVDPYKDPYYLEVTTPGLERKITTTKDFERFIDYYLDLKLFKKTDGFKEGKVICQSVTEGTFTFEHEGAVYTIDRSLIAKTSLHLDGKANQTLEEIEFNDEGEDDE